VICVVFVTLASAVVGTCLYRNLLTRQLCAWLSPAPAPVTRLVLAFAALWTESNNNTHQGC